MGLMRFLVHDTQQMSQERATRAYLCGHDRVPWPSQALWTNELLIIERPLEDSGSFYLPWEVDGYGELMLGTATLRERERPYLLEVELARGKLNQVRNQIAEWTSIGLNVPERLQELIRESTRHFAKAATNQHHPHEAAPAAMESLKVTLDAVAILTSSYADQALSARHRADPQLSTLLGATLGQNRLDEKTARQFLTTFNTGIVPMTWKEIEGREGQYDWSLSDAQVEWCNSNNLVGVGGPLLRLDSATLPEWLNFWEDDFATLVSFVCDFVEQTVGRYRGRIQLWECAACTNTGTGLSLTEEQRLRLTVRAIEATRQVDPEAQCLIRVDRPWAEYMTSGDWELSPIYFADALARADLGLAGVNLEINMGYLPGGSPTRDTLEVNRLLDLWSYLGLPLYITLTFPTSDDDDSLAYAEGKPVPRACADGWTPAAQRNWIERNLPLILAKRTVYGVFWNQLSDADPHPFPHGGLFGAEGRPKPALAALGAMRKYHLR
jgi:hypothetical protein